MEDFVDENILREGNFDEKKREEETLLEQMGSKNNKSDEQNIVHRAPYGTCHKQCKNTALQYNYK